MLDEQGYVVGILDEFGLSKLIGVAQHPDVCKRDRYRGKNTLGILSDFLAAPADMAVMIPLDEVRTTILGAATEAATAPASTDPDWVANPASLSAARFEVIDWGEDFTASGFPKSQLNSDAFAIAQQATEIFMRETGCVLCSEEAERTGDFSVTCICTGFAVTNHLIVTNDHCVPALELGDETTFRTAAGQDVSAVLIGRSSLDGTKSDIYGLEDYDVEGGDVALLRTTQRMYLTPGTLGDSDQLKRFDPVLSVGHPAVMARSGPYVTTVGHVLGHNPTVSNYLATKLPVHKGSSGSGIFNLAGELVGQVAFGGHYFQMEMDTVLVNEYGRRSLTIMTDDVF